MDPTEIVKAAPEVGKIAAALGFTDAVRRMLGPAADEVGEILRDRVKLYRYERQAKLLEKFDRITKEAGFTPQPVPPKILFPLLEGASFEDDENLHDMWAALLANAASPENSDTVRPGFIATLKQMAPDEARLLNWFYDTMTASPFKQIEGFTVSEVRAAFGWVDTKQRPTQAHARRISICLDGLEASQLIRRDYLISSRRDQVPGSETQDVDYMFSLTERGTEFIHVCRPLKATPWWR
jgi:Abortive infection alpha